MCSLPRPSMKSGNIRSSTLSFPRTISISVLHSSTRYRARCLSPRFIPGCCGRWVNFLPKPNWQSCALLLRLIGRNSCSVSSHSSAVAFSSHTYDTVWSLVKHKDRKIRLAIPRLLDWIRSLDPARDEEDPHYPFTLVAGQRRSYNANQIFRTPAWRKDDPDGALRI